MQEPTPSDTGRLMTQAEVADMLRRSVGWVRKQTRAGALPVVETGTERRPAPRYRRESIEAWVAGRERAAEAPNPFHRRRRGRAA